MAKTLVEQYVENFQNMRVFQQGRAILEVAYLLEKVMERKGVQRADLARSLGKSKGWVTQLLDDEANHTLRTITDVFAVLGHSLHFSIGSLDINEVYTPDLRAVWPNGHGKPIGNVDAEDGDKVSRQGVIVLPVSVNPNALIDLVSS